MRGNYEVVVIGGGAGGLSAALVLSRARRRVLVVDGGPPRNAPATHLHGFLSRDGSPPADLLTTGRAEVAAYGSDIVHARARDVDGARDDFVVTLDDGRRATARRIVLATGVTDQLLDIPGLSERWGRDVLHCPYCHGYEVADQPLGVLNAGPDAVDQAITIRHWSADVTLFTHGATLERGPRGTLAKLGIGVVTTPVSGLMIEDDRLTGVQLADGRVAPRTAMFAAPKLVVDLAPLARLEVATHQHTRGSFVTTDATGRTSVPGLWAIGNVTDPSAQLITAAGDGSRAAIDVNHDLVVQDAIHGPRNPGAIEE